MHMFRPPFSYLIYLCNSLPGQYTSGLVNKHLLSINFTYIFINVNIYIVYVFVVAAVVSILKRLLYWYSQVVCRTPVPSEYNEITIIVNHDNTIRPTLFVSIPLSTSVLATSYIIKELYWVIFAILSSKYTFTFIITPVCFPLCPSQTLTFPKN